MFSIFQYSLPCFENELQSLVATLPFSGQKRESPARGVKVSRLFLTIQKKAVKIVRTVCLLCGLAQWSCRSCSIIRLSNKPPAPNYLHL